MRPDADAVTPLHADHDGKRSATCGCQAALCCFSCPLAVCVLDVPWQEQRMAARRQRIRELRAAGKTHQEIAIILGVNERSVWRTMEGATA